MKAATFLGLEVGILAIALGAIWLFEQTHPTLGVTNSVSAIQQVLIVGLCLIVSFYYNDLYDLRVMRNFTDFYTHVPQAIGVAFILLAVIPTIFPGIRIESSSLVSIVRALFIVMSVVFLIRTVCYGLLRSRTFAERVLILGTSPLAQKIAAEIKEAPYAGYVIVGFVDDLTEPLPASVSSSQYPVVGPLDRLEHIIAELHPDRILLALTDRRGRLPVRDMLNATMNGVMVEDGVEVHERLTGKLAIESLNPSFLFLSKEFPKSPLQMALCRLTSLVVALLGLIVINPWMVLIALAIKLDSRGPVFEIQQCAGLRGRPFRRVQFRTRYLATATEAQETGVESKRTARSTRVGRVLQKLRVDHLPEFINVLRGDMDVVGPRPELLENVQAMSNQIPYYTLRLAVRPGMTGWAQVRHGAAGSLEAVTEEMRYDLYYVKHRSPWLDLRILIDTVKVLLVFPPQTEIGSEPREVRA